MLTYDFRYGGYGRQIRSTEACSFLGRVHRRSLGRTATQVGRPAQGSGKWHLIPKIRLGLRIGSRRNLVSPGCQIQRDG